MDPRKLSDNEKFGERIVFVRQKELGISREKAAEIMGLSYDSLARLEQGKRGVNVEDLCLFCRTFGLSIIKLIPPEMLDAEKILTGFTPVELIEAGLEKLKQNKTE